MWRWVLVLLCGACSSQPDSVVDSGAPQGADASALADASVADGSATDSAVDRDGSPAVADGGTADSTVSMDADVPSADAGPDLSGRILYLADHDIDDVYELYVARVDGVSPASVHKVNDTFADGMRVTQFAWSPDGTRVAYIADTAAGLPEVREAFVVDLSGPTPGPPVKVHADPATNGDASDLAWSPTSDWLAFRGDIQTDGVVELFVADTSGSTPQLGVAVNDTLPAGAYVRQDYLWSPVEDRLLYMADQAVLFTAEIFIVDLTGPSAGSPQRVNSSLGTNGDVVENSTTDTGFRWSPDGSRVFYLADADTDNAEDLYVVDVSGTPPWSANAVTAVTTTTRVQWATWSPDSTKIAFSTFDVQVHAADVSGPQPGPVYTLNSAGMFASRFSQWSPDSTRLAFHAIEVPNPGAPFELYVVDATDLANASPVRVNPTLVNGGKVPESGFGYVSFRWSPDASMVAYVAQQDTNFNNEIYVAGLTGVSVDYVAKANGPLPPPGNGVTDGYFVWNDDSAQLLYRAVGTTTGVDELYRATVVGDTVTDIDTINGPFAIGGDIHYVYGGQQSFAWSSNGALAAYIADQEFNEQVDLYVVRVNQTATGQAIIVGGNVPPGDVLEFAWEP